MKNEKVVRQMLEHQKSAEREKGKQEGITWWQLSLIGIGSIIGAGFFLGTGLAISITGPSVLIAFFVAGIIGFITFQALTEMTVNDPDPGTFRAYARKAFGDRMGFISGWIYWIAGVFIMASEITALSVFTRFWFHSVPLWVFAAIYSLLGLLINLLGAKDFGTIESLFAVVKILTLVLFIIFGLLFVLGILSKDSSSRDIIQLTRINWFPKGFKGFWSSMIFALFPFGGVAVVGVASSELKEKASIPRSINTLIITLIILYLLSLFFTLKTVSWQNVGGSESPFVKVLAVYNIPFADSILNFVIICAAFSTFVGTLFSITHVMLSLAQDREAPKAILETNKRGVAVKALLLSSIGLGITIVLSYLLPKTLYEYMATAAGALLILNWCIILTSQMRNRKRYEEESRNNRKIYKMPFYPYSSIMGIMLILLAVIGAGLRTNERMGLLVSLGVIVILLLVYQIIGMKKKIKGSYKK